MGQSLSLNVSFLNRMVYFIRENPRTKLRDTHKEAFFRALLSAAGGGVLRDGSEPAKRIRYNILQLILLSQ